MTAALPGLTTEHRIGAVYLELCGIPASGKTTLASTLVSHERRLAVGYSKRSRRLPLFASLARFIVTRLFCRGVWNLLPMIWRHDYGFAYSSRRANILIKEAIKNHLDAANNGRICDQGVSQALAAFLTPSINYDSKKLEQVLCALYDRNWPSNIVLVDADPCVAADRLEKRKSNPNHNKTDLDWVSHKKRIEIMRKQRHILYEICAISSQYTNVLVVPADYDSSTHRHFSPVRASDRLTIK